MMPKVCFIYRKYADTPSVERVFRILANEFEKKGIDIAEVQLPFGNGLFGVLANLLFFRVPEADVFHITGHVHYIALRLPADKTVLTVHDLGILRYRKGLRKKIIKKLFFEWPFKRLRFITAISEATKRDIIELANCQPEKVTVINDPLDPVMNGRFHRFNSERPAILQIGTASHKNLGRVIEAVRGLSCRLVVVGVLSAPLIQRLKKYEIEYEYLTVVNDHEMLNTYNRCDLVTFCSTFEGFGLPIIEAQSVAIPLIASNLPPMNEVAGEGAVLVDPFDAAQIRAAIVNVIHDAELRDKIVSAGKTNVKRFDPVKIADEYLRLYGQIEVKR
jgi:glycosyltransferase involved in cell wall biosynthesis